MLSSDKPAATAPVNGVQTPRGVFAPDWLSHEGMAIGGLLATGALLAGLVCGGAQSVPWLNAVFWLMAATATTVSFTRRLPVQNVLTAIFLIGGIGAWAHCFSAATDVPFGPCLFNDHLGAKLFGLAPWPIPLVWVVFVLNSRGVARLILMPWRKTSYYGFWVIGVAALLVVALDLAFEPFATGAGRYWFWRTPMGVLAWHHAPWVNFFAWYVITVGALVIATPWLINKQPVKQPTDFHPLIMWSLLMAGFAASHLLLTQWTAGLVTIAALMATNMLALKGAK